MTLNRPIALSLVLAITALAPATALAKHGADDPPGDDRGGRAASRTTAAAPRATARRSASPGRARATPARSSRSSATAAT